MSRFVEACGLGTLVSGKLRRVNLDGEQILLVRDGDNVYALEDRCTHEDFPLSDGWVDDGCVYCPMHGAKFDIKTGEALSLPAYEDVKSFPVRIRDDKVEVDIG